MVFALLLALASPADWVPARWNWTEPETLGLLKNTPINCLLIDWAPGQAASAAAFAARAYERGIATLAVLYPKSDAVGEARAAVRAKLNGVVLDGEFPEGAAARVRDAITDAKAIVIELTSRRRMDLNGPSAVLGTYQGVWAGIQVMEDGHAKSGPSGSAWIDTNGGFIRAVRAWTDAPLWLGNRPPTKSVVTAERYLQVICDAAMVGARWVFSFDDDFARRLKGNEEGAAKSWALIAQHLQFIEDHKEWRALKPYAKLALVQDVNQGALLSGGILDMIAVKHTPVRPVPKQRMDAKDFLGVSMAVNVDGESLTPAEREILSSFARGGGTLLTGPPGWRDTSKADGDPITLEKEELERLDRIWKEVNSMIGRRNLGARLFNVSTMLSNLMASPDGKQVFIHLLNYSEYPVENVTVHFLGNFLHARMYTPDGQEKVLEVYKNEDGTGVDIDKVSTFATLRLD